jgi:hypothetical protein
MKQIMIVFLLTAASNAFALTCEVNHRMSFSANIISGPVFPTQVEVTNKQNGTYSSGSLLVDIQTVNKTILIKAYKGSDSATQAMSISHLKPVELVLNEPDSDQAPSSSTTVTVDCK